MGAGGLAMVASTWHRRVREDMEVDRVDRVKTVDERVKRRLMGLGVRPSEDKVARVEWFGGLGLKTIPGRFTSLGLKTRGSVVEPKATSGGFRGFGPQNPGGASEEAGMTRGGILEVASRR